MDDIKRPRFWAARMRQILRALPCVCEICARPATNLLCEPCRLRLAHNDQCCIQCAEALPATMGRASAPQSQRCGRCIANPPVFQQTFFAYDYSGPVATLIQRFKFSEALMLNHLLADMVTSRLRLIEFPLPDALIPVPLHPARLKQRGFNQSLELAKCIGKALNIPVLNTLLVRTRNTPNQSGLDRKTRETNIKGAFRFRASNDNVNLAGKNLAIIDDVITTGSTMREVATVLKHSGPGRINVIVVAKTHARVGGY